MVEKIIAVAIIAAVTVAAGIAAIGRALHHAGEYQEKERH